MVALPSLIVGLGNPGREYAHTRHNIGFVVVDELCRRGEGGALRSKFSGEFGKLALRGQDLSVLKPETFMNESGRSVQPAAAFFHLEPRDILVVHDELDLPFGELRLKVGGGHAGHNGLRSIVQCLGSAEFIRLRVGIGRPPASFSGDTAGYVLSGFTSAERAELAAVVAKACAVVERLVQVGVARAMNEINVRPKPPKAAPAASPPAEQAKDSSGPSDPTSTSASHPVVQKTGTVRHGAERLLAPGHPSSGP